MSWVDIKEGSLVATIYYPGNIPVKTYRIVKDLKIWCHECDWEDVTEVTVDYSPKTLATAESHLVSFVCPECGHVYKSEPRLG